ncbi:MAG: ankyrin repeat domain-containing protein [Treponema sp.]|nr:ankyrin repeat domain-containing protein [Treponema sp.]
MRWFLFISILALTAVFTACSSAPRSGNDNMWELLAHGDDRAREFFLGEFDVHARDPAGRTPLHYAAALDDHPLAVFFIALGAELDARDDSGQTPLGVAAQSGHANAARVIAAAGADIHKPSGTGVSPAMTALRAGNDNFLQAILTTSATLNSTDGNERTILHLASAGGNPQAIKTIIAALDSVDGMNRVLVAAGHRNSPLDRRDSAGHNPLDIALSRTDSRDHMEVAEQLILAGAISQGLVYHYFAPAARNANFDLRRADGLAPLHFAASQGYTGLIEFLICRGANVNIQNPSGATPLHEAVRSGNTTAISLLLDGQADIDALDANGNTMLHIAVPAANHASVIRLLLNNGINPNQRDIHGDSPLHVLVTLNRRPDVVRTLLSGNVDVSVRNIRGQTPLHIAVQENRLQLIPLLLDAGSEIFAADNSGVTPFQIGLRQRGAILNALITSDTARQTDSAGNTMLHIAIQNGIDTQVIGNILDRNANVNTRNRDGDTPLHIATRTNRREAGEYILARGADVFSSNAAGDSPLRLALTHRSGVLQWLFNPRTVEARDGMGNTMLHYVALWRMDRHIPFMIQQGISTEAANATGETPLFWAVHHDGASTARALLSAGANLHARDSLGNSALHSAVRWNAVNATNTLLDAGIDVNVHSLNGTTPLHDSVRLGNTNIAGILINRGANLEVRDSGGNTPFMESVRAGHTEAANLLSRRGADPMTRNANGDTPLHFAVTSMDHSMIDTLLRMGVSIHARNTRNRTPFQIALNDSPGTVAALLGGNRINSTDDFGNSPLHVAIQERVSISTLQVIVDKGSRLTAVDSNGRIPLRLAVDMSAWDQARILADAGSDPFMAAVDEVTPGEIAIASGRAAIESIFSGRAINARDPSGNTVLHHAARMGRPETISLLIGLGADMSVRNISKESPADIAVRWNNHENAALLN